MFNKRQPGRVRQEGFTLVEVIVMMAVLSVGIFGTLSVANLAVRSSDRNEQRVAAANLAREGVELVRAIRDSNWAAKLEGSGSGCWDYYPATADLAQAVPYSNGCNPRLSALTNPDQPTNFVASLNLGNGMPYLASANQDNNQTQNSLYQLCKNAAGIYTPNGDAACPHGGKAFYRRVTVTRMKDLGIDPDDNDRKYNLRVQSFVSWPGNGGPDLIVEEYLTDWRKF